MQKYIDISKYIHISSYISIYISIYIYDMHFDMRNNYKDKSGQFEDEDFPPQLLESEPQVHCSPWIYAWGHIPIPRIHPNLPLFFLFQWGHILRKTPHFFTETVKGETHTLTIFWHLQDLEKLSAMVGEAEILRIFDGMLGFTADGRYSRWL